MHLSAQLHAAIIGDHQPMIVDFSSVPSSDLFTDQNAFGSSPERVNSHLSKIVRAQTAPLV